MSRKIDPRLRRSNVMLDSFSSCVSNTSEEFAWTPEMPFSEISSKPGMLLQEPESRCSFEQLQCLANTHCGREFNKQVDMVDSNMQLVDFTPIFNCNFCDESLDINSDPIEFHRVSCVFRFPHKVEGILPKAMAKRLQFHFLSPQTFIRNKVLTMFEFNLFKEGTVYPSFTNTSQELNFVGSPPLLENRGTRALAM